VAAVVACAALQVAAQAQGPGETLTGVEARAARLGHAADVVITAVSDGDTATAVIEGRPLRLRLARIDAPEHRQAWGQRAEQSLRQLVWKKQVHIEWREVDRNGRPIVTMTVDGLDVSEEQVRARHGLGLSGVQQGPAVAPPRGRRARSPPRSVG
jgi:micrococcal nuclease